MSAFSDAMKAIREVILMQSRIDNLHAALAAQSDQMKTLATTVIEMDRRLARLEGMIEGVAMAGRARRRLPEK